MDLDTARALSENLASLLRREHGALGEFIVALADFDRHRGWEELGHASLFSFLHCELRLSKAAAQYRKVAAELVQQVPAVAEALRDGRLCMTSVIEAARVVTVDNWKTVLPRFFGLSRREAMDVVAALQPEPAPPTRTVVTAGAMPAPRVATLAAPELLLAPLREPDLAGVKSSSPGEPAPAPAPRPVVLRPTDVVPLTAQDRRLHMTVSKKFLAKLAAATDAHAHTHPGASAEEILEAGLDLLLEKAAKRRGAAKKPLKVPRPSKPDHVPAHVRRAVWARDGARCAYPLASGGVCGSTRCLEIDHVEPLAKGGASTIENCRLACQAHNLRAARLVLGDGLMDRYAPLRRPGTGGASRSSCPERRRADVAGAPSPCTSPSASPGPVAGAGARRLSRRGLGNRARVRGGGAALHLEVVVVRLLEGDRLLRQRPDDR